MNYQRFIQDFWLGGESQAMGNVGGLGASPPETFCGIWPLLSEVDFRYNFDVYTHAAVTFLVHDAMSIDSTNSQSIQLILQNSWGGET